MGLLKQSLYGTRDAAANFQAEIKKHMIKLGFQVGVYNPSTFYHVQRKIRTLVHGDDFISVASRSQLDWLKKGLEERFEISTKVVGRVAG